MSPWFRFVRPHGFVAPWAADRVVVRIVTLVGALCTCAPHSSVRRAHSRESVGPLLFSDVRACVARSL